MSATILGSSLAIFFFVAIIALIAFLLIAGPETFGLTWGIAAVLILATMFLLPLGIGGFSIMFKLIELLNAPIIGGSIPIWAIAAVLMGVIMFLRRKG